MLFDQARVSMATPAWEKGSGFHSREEEGVGLFPLDSDLLHALDFI